MRKDIWSWMVSHRTSCSTTGAAAATSSSTARAPIPVILEPSVRDGRGAIRREVLVGGFRFEVEVESERRAALRERATRSRPDAAAGGPHEIRALIPGKVVSLAVGPGDTVTAGQQLLVVEAMKMQNELRAPRGGTIGQLGVAQGVNIEVGDLLLVIS